MLYSMVLEEGRFGLVREAMMPYELEVVEPPLYEGDSYLAEVEIPEREFRKRMNSIPKLYSYDEEF